MKKYTLITFILLVTITTLQAATKATPQNLPSLPEVSREFLSAYFPAAQISHVKVERILFWKRNYDVILTDGTNIEFDRKGEWKEIERYRTPVPSTLIPGKITDYVQTHFSEQMIVFIERERFGYEIELENDIELLFDFKGNFIRMD
ncbi:PepSY-like domain-containing protein [Parabacteroides sp. OttesenSCG-928-G21]|jgi:hypothetical protein|nr:PepSY-like domain-containing protein [Parabacteroides sp. OttesenSCG-928-G21]